MTVTAGLDQIAEQYRGAPPGVRAVAGATLEVALGKLCDHMDYQEKLMRRRAQAATILPFPAQAFPVVGGTLAVPVTIADALAPKDGYLWAVTYLAVDGLVAQPGASVQASGTVTSPGAAATIANIASLPAGTWVLNWNVGLAGTLAAADGDNFKLIVAGSSAENPSNNPPAAGLYPQEPVQIVVPAGGAAVSIRTVAAGTVGAVYSAELNATPAASDQVTLYRGPGLAIAAQPQNRKHTFTAAGAPGPGPDWTPGKHGLILQHQDALVLAGTNLAASQVVLSGDAVQIESWLLADYIL